MFGKLQPYFYLIVFFLLIFILFRFLSGVSEEELFTPDKYISHKLVDNHLEIETENGKTEIRFLNEKILEVQFSNPDNARIDSSHAVIMEAGNIPVSLQETKDKLIFSGGELSALIYKNPFSIFYILSGDTLARQWAGFFDNDSARGFGFWMDKDESIYGTGFRTIPTNRRGYKVELYNQPHYGYSLNAPNLNFSVPLALSSKCYAIFFDNVQRGYLDIGKSKSNILEFGSGGGKMGYYFIADTNFDSLMKSYAELTGFQPMPPRWAFGNLMSRFGYRNPQEITNIVDKMQDEKFPLDAVIIDLYWFGKGEHGDFRMGDIEWDYSVWPEPEQMIARLKKKGVKTILVTEPFILEESRNFEPLSKQGLLSTDNNGKTFVIEDFWFGHSGLLDIFKPAARDWFWQKYKNQIEIGVDGWWGDLGEPEKHPSGMQHVVGSSDEVHNIYAHYWNKMLFERYAQQYPETRLFNLNRSGFAGSQRFAVFPWSGDVYRSWEGLQAQFPAVLGMTLSGFSYMHSDLGGFAQGEKDEELYTRWLQYGAFNPVFRPHSSKIPSEPIFFSDSVKDVVRKYIKLRYRLMPYNYSMAWKNSTEGTPLTRPLFFEEPDNPELRNIDDEYFWGDEFLIAPVIEKGRKERDVYLPKGVWFNFFTGKKLSGGRWIKEKVRFENIPVFVRAGSFIPMVPDFYSTSFYSSDTFRINYYPDTTVPESEFIIYEDDGKTAGAYKKGLYELIKLRGRTFEDLILIDVSREGGEYEGMPAKRKMEFVIFNLPQTEYEILLNSEIIPVVSGIRKEKFKRPPPAIYEKDTGTLKISFGWTCNKDVLLQVRMTNER